MRNLLILGGGAAALAAIVLGVYVGTRPGAPTPAATGPVPPAAAQPAAPASLPPELTPSAADYVLGSPDAPVTIVEYASLTCGHCATFHNNILPDLKKKYIDTGKAKLVFRDFPLDRDAALAAMVAECSGRDRYFATLEVLFRAQGVWSGPGKDAVGEIKKLVRIGGMSEAQVDACVSDAKLFDAILAERQVGEKLGVESTPTLIINGQRYPGARPLAEYDDILGRLIK